MVLPAARRMPRRAAASNRASTEWAWTEQNTRALVTPLRSISSQNRSAVASAWARSAKASSAGKA